MIRARSILKTGATSKSQRESSCKLLGARLLVRGIDLAARPTLVVAMAPPGEANVAKRGAQYVPRGAPSRQRTESPATRKRADQRHPLSLLGQGRAEIEPFLRPADSNGAPVVKNERENGDVTGNGARRIGFSLVAIRAPGPMQSFRLGRSKVSVYRVGAAWQRTGATSCRAWRIRRKLEPRTAYLTLMQALPDYVRDYVREVSGRTLGRIEPLVGDSVLANELPRNGLMKDFTWPERT